MRNPRVVLVLPPTTYFAVLLTHGHQWSNEPVTPLQDFKDGAALALVAPWWPDHLTTFAHNPYTHTHAMRRHYLIMRTR